MTNWLDCRSISVNYLYYLKTSRVEALAEIFDFAAGLVQRVPNKPNGMKADLQNSTAFQGDNHPPKNKKTVLIVRFIICSHAPLIEKLTHTVPMEPAPPRHPHGTQNILLSAASVKT